MKWVCFSQALTDCRQGEVVELCWGPVAMKVVFPVSIGKPHKMNNWEEFVGRHTRMRGPPCLLSDSCWFINWLALSNSTWILFSMNSMLNKLLLEHKSDTSIWKHFRNGKMEWLQACGIGIYTYSRNNTMPCFPNWNLFQPIALFNDKCNWNQISVVGRTAIFPSILNAAVVVWPKGKGTARKSSSVFSQIHFLIFI